LAVLSEHVAAPVPDPETVGRQGRAAAEQIAPGHAAGAIAESGGGRPARSQVVHVEGAGNRARQAEEKESGDEPVHPRPPPFFADRICLGANAGNDHPRTADVKTKFAQVF
jgi:hypothetical protein